jgi:hypothetical protein
MLELIRRKSGRENIIFIFDEVGQYVAARDNLILNLDGLAKNIKLLGNGKAWLVATAQQMLTEDDPRAQMNTGKLFKLKDRFPIPVELEASDIREICYRRLLTKSSTGESKLAGLFDTQGQSLRNHTQLGGTRFFKSDLDKKVFCNLYPFLPQHFDILLALLGRLAKTSGGVGACARRSRSFKMCWWIRAVCVPVNRCWPINPPARWPRRRSFTTLCGTTFANPSVT